MKRVVVFNIKNVQEDYAKCLQFMEKIRTNKEEEIHSNLSVTCTSIAYNGNFYPAACDVEQSELEEWNHQEKYDHVNLLWCFRIQIEKEDDIVNLMYFYMIRQMYQNTFAILLTPNLEYDMKISAYLYFEIEKDRNVVFIKTLAGDVEKYRAVHRLAGSSTKEKRELKLTKFLPLIEVTEDTYECLAKTVGDAKRNLEYGESATYYWEKTFLNTCTRLFTQYHSKQSESLLTEEKFVNVVHNVTVLTYILFCAFRNHCPDRRNVFELSKIEQELSDARDIAEGILQILENIILHSQNKVGYFSFRIHDKEKSGYLRKTYSKYMSSCNHDSVESYLEIFVADSFLEHQEIGCRNILCAQFLDNLSERSKQNHALHPFIQKYKNLETKDFFDNKIWSEYYAVGDNIIEHYGLQLFDKIVESCNGCFEVTSTTGYESSMEQRYSTMGIDQEESFVFPGTQYRVLLPIAEKNYEQEYVGLDFYDYPKTAMLKPIQDGIFSYDVDLERCIIGATNRIKQEIQQESNEINRAKRLKRKLIIELSHAIYIELEKSVNAQPQYIVNFLLNTAKGAGLIEIIFKSCMKALIQLRSSIGNDKKIYISFGKLTREFITEFCYLMGIYYYKAEDSQIMLNTEMYLWDAGYCEDLMISGKTLNVAHYAIVERALLRGIYPQWLNFVDYVWKKHNNFRKNADEHHSVMVLPYDVIVKDSGKTIFEHVVEKVLQRPFEQQELGCLIKDVHVQLASRIHISEFYFGQALFLNNYFVNYFSYLLVKDIGKRMKETKNEFKNIILVGYESYSEMLLVEMGELLRSYIEDNQLSAFYHVSPYIVCEMSDKKMTLRSEQGPVDDVDFYRSQANNVFVCVVPMNSTMMTFETMQCELEKKLSTSITSENNIANYALVVSRDDYLNKCCLENVDRDCVMTEAEEEYWKQKTARQIVTKGKKIGIKYFIEVCTGWETALECEQCFPKDCICEKPLIKTDITGLSLQTQLGERRKWLKQNHTSKENLLRLKCLTQVLTYNHIKREDNHYLYYFDTITFFYQNQAQIQKWLDTICIEDEERTRCYNFIVSPLHATNAGFTEEINKRLFSNTAHIIRMDFGRTYRSNFMKQFSYLQILYRNIMQNAHRLEGKIEINFYFVDDEIVSGKTMTRAKSLIEGLFESFPKIKNIEVHVFKKIFVLLSRLSDASKSNYINNVNDYESYVDFNVSGIQNHDEFCFMCKLVERANHYKLMAATNKMDEGWGKIEEKFLVKDYIKAQQNPDYKQEKYAKRMMAAHYAEAEMWNLPEHATLKQYFWMMLNRLFYTRLTKKNGQIILNDRNKETFISFIKTLSRPFFVYRNRAKEATLHLLIAFSECLLGTEYDELWHRLNGVIMFEEHELEHTQKVWKAIFDFVDEWRMKMDNSTSDLLLELMEQLADMESNYLIRRNHIMRIFELYNSILKHTNPTDEEAQKKEEIEFELKYAMFIKQLTNEDADEMKSLWLEHLLYKGWEMKSIEDSESSSFNLSCGYHTSFGRSILIENTKIIYDGIKCLAEVIDDKRWKEYGDLLLHGKKCVNEFICDIKAAIKANTRYLNTKSKYFMEVLKHYGFKFTDENIVSEVLFLGLMFKMKTEEIPFDAFYRNFYWLVKSISGAEVQMLIVPNTKDIDEELFYRDKPCVIYDNRQEGNRERNIKLQDKPLVDNEYLKKATYEMDTYFINHNQTRVIIKYSINSKRRDGKDSIYLLLQYPTEQEIRKLLFDIRFILLFRSRTITRMKHDFNNNLFQSMWQTKKHNMLLEHFKNVSHINPKENDAINKILNYIQNVEQCYEKGELDIGKDRGIRIYKALLLKMMADNNISSIYHEILAKRLLCNFVRTKKFGKGQMFSGLKELGFIFSNNDNINELFAGEQSFPEIQISQEVFESDLYYIAPNSSSSQLAIISLIQNAFKHGNGKQDVRIYRERGIGEEKNAIDYLCITNGIDTNDIEKTKSRIEEHIRRPVASRRIDNKDDKCDGITLFSINQYCKRLVEKLQNKECKESLIKCEIKGQEIVFKIPILKGEC